MMPQDVIKMCYQASFGAEHLLTDTDAARKYLFSEYEAVAPLDTVLYESISDEVCRVNLSAWKHRGFSLDTLLELFISSAAVSDRGRELFDDYIAQAGALISSYTFRFSPEEWTSFLNEYMALGMPAIRHSDEYRRSERPSYRIVKQSLLEASLN